MIRAIIDNLAISKKLYLLLLLPTLLVIWLVTSQLMTNFNQLKVSTAVIQAVENALVMNGLTDALQAERGASGVFLASQGARFADRLQRLRQQSDAQMRRCAPLWPCRIPSCKRCSSNCNN
ncbi:nitrate- and nitrite sensing domain-containing protein [Alkalimonas sp. NCh-2]|uniref:nitrate- and nitrite sensing domain-containing protein n=1 Tax=Alkalimonas sp. NCh-2 TaxID=3144846 RepID=UPI0031F6E9ED